MGFGRSESRVKVKAPKSGLERLELVLDSDNRGGGGGGRQQQRHHSASAYESRGDSAHYEESRHEQRDGYYADDRRHYYADTYARRFDPPALVSSHSESTTETDNRASARSRSLSQTWSMESDDRGNMHYVAQRRQNSLESLPEDIGAGDNNGDGDEYERQEDPEQHHHGDVGQFEKRDKARRQYEKSEEQEQYEPYEVQRKSSPAAAYESFDSEVDLKVPKYGYIEQEEDDDDGEQYYDAAMATSQQSLLELDDGEGEGERQQHQHYDQTAAASKEEEDGDDFYEDPAATATPRKRQEARKSVSFDQASYDSDADLASFASEPAEHQQVGGGRSYRKSVSFDSGADLFSEASEQHEHKQQVVKRKAHSDEDTSAESVGWKVTTTWSSAKENEAPPEPPSPPKRMSPPKRESPQKREERLPSPPKRESPPKKVSPPKREKVPSSPKIEKSPPNRESPPKREKQPSPPKRERLPSPPIQMQQLQKPPIPQPKRPPPSPPSPPPENAPAPKSAMRDKPRYSLKRRKNIINVVKGMASSSRHYMDENALAEDSESSPEHLTDQSPSNQSSEDRNSDSSSDSESTVSVVTEAPTPAVSTGKCSVVTEPPTEVDGGTDGRDEVAKQLHIKANKILQQRQANQRPKNNAHTRKGPEKSVSMITRHPSYVQTDIGAQSVVSGISTDVSTFFGQSTASELADVDEPQDRRPPRGLKPTTSNLLHVAVGRQNPSPDLNASERSENDQRQQQRLSRAQQPQQRQYKGQQNKEEHPHTPTFQHRRTLPRDHPSNAAANNNRLSLDLQRTNSNVSLATSATSAYSNAALDGYVPPQSTTPSRPGRAAAGLRKTAKKIKNVGKLWRRKKAGSGDTGDSDKVKKDKGAERKWDDEFFGPPPPPRKPASPAGGPTGPSRLTPTPPLTDYRFEGYDHLKSPKGPSPPQSVDTDEPAGRMAGDEDKVVAASDKPWETAGEGPPGRMNIAIPSRGPTQQAKAKPGGGGYVATPNPYVNPWAGMSSPSERRNDDNAPPNVATAADNKGKEQQQAANNPFLRSPNSAQPLSPPNGSYNLQGSGMPSVKWWSWRQPSSSGNESYPGNRNESGKQEEGEDCTFFALMCMFPPAEATS